MFCTRVLCLLCCFHSYFFLSAALSQYSFLVQLYKLLMLVFHFYLVLIYFVLVRSCCSALGALRRVILCIFPTNLLPRCKHIPLQGLHSRLSACMRSMFTFILHCTKYIVNSARTRRIDGCDL